MNRFCAVLLVTCGVFCISQRTLSQTLDKKDFGDKVYSIEAISHFGLDDRSFAALSEADKQDIIASRNDLIATFRAVQTKRDAMPYVTIEMARKYKTSKALAASLIAPETIILAAGISDFAIPDRGTITMHFFVVAFSEGDIVISEKSATLKKTDLGWRVAGFV